MSLPIFFCLLATFVAVFCQKKLPIYVGLGYNLLSGNPLSDHVDPGFTHPVFRWTYNLNKVVEKDKYMVPDQIVYDALSVCSFQSVFSNYTGGQSYQKDLKAKI